MRGDEVSYPELQEEIDRLIIERAQLILLLFHLGRTSNDLMRYVVLQAIENRSEDTELLVLLENLKGPMEKVVGMLKNNELS